MKLILMPILFISLISFGQSIGPAPRKLTPISFIDVFCEESSFRKDKIDTLFLSLTVFGEFPENWIKESDIDSLFKIISSRQKCRCMVNPAREHTDKIPNDTCAEKGGFASQFIKAYKDKKQYSFGLFSCPQVDKDLNYELIKWWGMEHDK